MKTKSFIFSFIFLFASMLFSCNEATEDLSQTKNPEIEYKELTAEEVLLKSQLAEVAKIVAEIASDQEVLDEIVATIKMQPRVMEDRVKFADLMSPKQQLKSGNIEVKTGKFASAFKNKLSKSGLKSASTLIESLASQGIEIYIPYPIEDYPAGTEVVITSHPIDNLCENIGYAIGNFEKPLTVNYELTRNNPIVIIMLSTVTSDEIKNAISNRTSEIRIKSINTDPMAEWENTSKTFTIFMDYLYIKNDYVPDINIFEAPGVIHFCSGGVTFNSQNSVISDVANSSAPNHYGLSFPKKYEKDAKNGYVKGMFPTDQRFIMDWHPGIESVTLAFFMDRPTKTITQSMGLSATVKGEFTIPINGVSLLLKPEGTITKSTSSTLTFGDYLYGNQPWARYSYKQLYYVGDTWSQVHGNANVQISNGDYRPVRKLTNELYYVTHCEVGIR